MSEHQDTLPGMNRVFHCPLTTCTWTYVEAEDGMSPEELEAVFVLHNAHHTYEEALHTIATLQAMLAQRDTRINELADLVSEYRATYGVLDGEAPMDAGRDYLGSAQIKRVGTRLPEESLSPELKAMRDEIRRARGQ